ncbi:hypothetical protein KOR34_16850 [Posidoniimonas corsicana]|uniref:Uncharacterized protein n=1 Tax=Posidoniimonas corsicana TaxID=1938618 RepID=A0A5C5VGC0_9BACT|nr:hypothetical protein KOR34_16850 [Posidoniimonas corsicana]
MSTTLKRFGVAALLSGCLHSFAHGGEPTRWLLASPAPPVEMLQEHRPFEASCLKGAFPLTKDYFRSHGTYETYGVKFKLPLGRPWHREPRPIPTVI